MKQLWQLLDLVTRVGMLLSCPLVIYPDQVDIISFLGKVVSLKIGGNQTVSKE
jgi:hypothetical protein